MKSRVLRWVPLFVSTCLFVAIAVCQSAALDSPTAEESNSEWVNSAYPSLEAFYKHLHANPELSFHEEKTATYLAAALKQVGCEVTEQVGKTGVVALLKNGDGPRVMVRTDMDALPVTEATGLPYASRVTTKDDEGNTVGVMHACGHDMHMTCLVGTARFLAASRDRWRGTVMFVCQPAEEGLGGARAMLADRLFERFPKPDFALALHCDSTMPAGLVGFRPGYILANVDSVDVTIRGRGGHGSQPNAAIDPIVIAARFVLDLQTIVSREKSPTDPGVVTVGSIHGGTKRNIIPDDVKLQLTVRSYSDETRKLLLDSIKIKAQAAAASARAPEPTVVVVEGTPSTYNDPVLTERMAGVARAVWSDDKVLRPEPRMGGEDFSEFGRAGVPICMFWLGTAPLGRLDAAQRGTPMPSLHSALYFPDPEPSIKTGVRTMSELVLNLVGKPSP